MQPEPRRKRAPVGEAIATIGMRLTDTGNAERLVARHRHEIRYCHPRKRWLIWDGKRWAWDLTAQIEQISKRTVRAIYAEAEHARDSEQAEAVAKHATYSEKRERRAAMVALAQSEPGIPVIPSELDADPYAFNVNNGTVDLSTGELRPHDRDDLITKLASVDYVPGARHELWERYLSDATGGDRELATYLRRMAGYSLYGRVVEKAWWFLYGPPDGTKSTFINALSDTLGDYAVAADFSTWLVQTSTGGNRGDLVALMGARLVCSVEARKGVKFDEAIMKRVTGGDPIKAAAKYEAEVEFQPTFALWLAANDAPVARDDDEGFWNRVRRIPFVNVIPKERQDRMMREKLAAPEVRSAILAWAVEGCIAWQRDGFGACKAVDDSTAKYRREMDRAAGFFDERCKFDPSAEVTIKRLREAYEEWCKEASIRAPLSKDELAGRLKHRGCRPGKVERQRGWHGVRLLAEWEAPETAETAETAFPLNPSHEERAERLSREAVPAVPAVPLDHVDELERAAIQAEGGGCV